MSGTASDAASLSKGQEPVRLFDLALPEGLSSPTNGASLVIEASPHLTVPRLLHRQGLAGYEPETLAAFLAAIESVEPAAVYDIGANVGLFALLAAAAGVPEVSAFEPEPTLAGTARRLALANGLKAVQVELVALSDFDGRTEFYLSSTGDSSNSLVKGYRAPTGTIQVDVQTLDRWVSAHDVKPGLIKLDVESAEPQVLNGGRDFFARNRPWLICEVLAGRVEEDLMRFLGSLDYTWHQITQENPLVERTEIFGDRGGTFRNWLFAPTRPSDGFWKRRAVWMSRLIVCRPVPDTSLSTTLDLVGPTLDTHNGPEWAPTWNKPYTDDRFRAEPLTRRRIRLTVDVGDGRQYLSHGRTGFESPPDDAALWPLRSDTEYSLSWSAEDVVGDPKVDVYVVQYDESSRLATDSVSMLERGTLRVLTSSSTVCMRLAIRASGLGAVTIGPFSLASLD